MSATKPGVVYVIDGGHGLVKVGKTTNAAKRLRSIQTMGGLRSMRTWTTTEIFDETGLEGAAHELLAEHRVVGEWFSCSFEIAVSTVEALVPDFAAFDQAIASENLAARRAAAKRLAELFFPLPGAQPQFAAARERALQLLVLAGELETLMNATMAYLPRAWSIPVGGGELAALRLFMRLMADARIQHVQAGMYMAAGGVMEVHRLLIGDQMSVEEFASLIVPEAKDAQSAFADELTLEQLHAFWEAQGDDDLLLPVIANSEGP